MLYCLRGRVLSTEQRVASINRHHYHAHLKNFIANTFSAYRCGIWTHLVIALYSGLLQLCNATEAAVFSSCVRCHNNVTSSPVTFIFARDMVHLICMQMTCALTYGITFWAISPKFWCHSFVTSRYFVGIQLPHVLNQRRLNFRSDVGVVIDWTLLKTWKRFCPKNYFTHVRIVARNSYYFFFDNLVSLTWDTGYEK